MILIGKGPGLSKLNIVTLLINDFDGIRISSKKGLSERIMNLYVQCKECSGMSGEPWCQVQQCVATVNRHRLVGKHNFSLIRQGRKK